MEREFTNENMEDFLRQSADGLRMRPSAKVWKGITKHLNRRKRRIRIILGTSLLLTTALGYYLTNETTRHLPATSHSIKTENSTAKPTPIVHNNSERTLTAFTNSNQIKNKQATFSTSFKPTTDKNNNTENTIAFTQEVNQLAFTPTIVDSYFENRPVEENTPTAANNRTTIVTDPLTIESVVNSYQPKQRKLAWQTYFTPTVSYRKLNDNYIDNVATHKPAFGFELGMAAKYALSKNVKLRGGLQFNVNRYEIKTYDSYSQQAVIRLNERNGGVDYVRTMTNYNNFSGYKSSWIQNFYFQVSAPVGVELKIKGDDHMQFGIASTVQPTYLLGDKAYLISSDYKNYAEMSKLVRRWNVNTSLETYVAYSTGHLNWQVGPQVRYQLLSSYQKKYPVKENLFDFGLRVGISVNK